MAKRRESPATSSFEPPQVNVKCKRCEKTGRAGVEIHPWNAAHKKLEWLCRPCKSGDAGSAGDGSILESQPRTAASPPAP